MRHILIENEIRGVFPMPWRYDSNCLNFRTPDEKIKSSEVKELDRLDEIETLVIRCDLDDYGFISKMTALRQLYIYTAGNVRDLDFLKNLIYLSHLCIKGSQITSLEPLTEFLKKKKEIIDESAGDFRKRIRLQMGGISISSEFDLDGACLNTEVHVSEIYINGISYADKPY